MKIKISDYTNKIDLANLRPENYDVNHNTENSCFCCGHKSKLEFTTTVHLVDEFIVDTMEEFENDMGHYNICLVCAKKIPNRFVFTDIETVAPLSDSLELKIYREFFNTLGYAMVGFPNETRIKGMLSLVRDVVYHRGNSTGDVNQDQRSVNEAMLRIKKYCE